MTRSIKQEYHIKADIEDVFDALLTPSMIKKWWFAASAIVIPEKGGIYALAWGEDIDQPDYISVATISELNRPERLVFSDFRYYSKEGNLPFEAEFGNEFILKKEKEETTIIVIQTGFPDDNRADEFYNACGKGWQDTMSSLKNTLEKK